MSGPVPAETVASEVRTHHERLARWLNGSDPEALTAFRASHTADFTLVSTAGEVVPGPRLLDGLAAAHGTRPTLRITVHDVWTVHATRDTVLVRFTERHEDDGRVDVRIVSALLCAVAPDDGAPDGSGAPDSSGAPDGSSVPTGTHRWKWRHVHETAA